MIFETAMRRNNTYFDLIKGREVVCAPAILDLKKIRMGIGAFWNDYLEIREHFENKGRK